MDIEIIEIELDNVVSGWLSPSGVFYGCGWGEHYDTAIHITKENNWFRDYLINRRSHITRCVKDYLVQEKNFILLDNPSYNKGIQIVQFNPFKRHSKKQTSKLLELFNYDNRLIHLVSRQ